MAGDHAAVLPAGRVSRRSRGLGGPAAVVVVGFFVLWTLAPLYWMLATSFKDALEAARPGPTIWPAHATAQNYVGLATGNIPFPTFLLNSVVTSLGAAVATTVLATLAAYSFSRGRYLLRGPVMYVVLATQMLPLVVLLIPLYLLFLRAGLLDTYQGIILGYCSFTLPFGAWMMKGFIDAVPREIEDAARVDGASPAAVLLQIVTPMVVPGILTTATFTFMNAWNNLLFPLTFTTSMERRTLPAGLLLSFTGVFKTDWGGMMAASVVTTLPLAIGFLFLQRALVRGLTSGGLTGG
jgi:ABC-type glycerol-3-phosphate transport system permease component